MYQRELVCKSGSVAALAWSPDSRRLAVKTSERMITIWDVPAAKESLTIDDNVAKPPHAYGAGALAWDPQNRFIMGSHVWNVDGTRHEKQLPKFDPATMPLTCLSMSANGEKLVVEYGTAGLISVRLYDLPTWSADPKEYKPTPRAGAEVYAANAALASLSPDGKQVALINDSPRTLEVRDRASRDVLWRGVALENGRSVAFNSAGQAAPSDSEAESDLFYYVQDSDGSTEVLSSAEFHKRVGAK